MCICGMQCSKIHTGNKETYNRKLEPLPNQDVVGIICPVFYSLRFQWVCTTNKTYSILNSHNALTLWMSGCVLGGYHLWLERGSGESLSNNGLHHYEGQHYHTQTNHGAIYHWNRTQIKPLLRQRFHVWNERLFSKNGTTPWGSCMTCLWPLRSIS